jgi:predicted RNA-binding Zn ribbon-like protein
LSSKTKTRSAEIRRGEKQRDELAIRFVNTAAWRLRETSEERMGDVASFDAWLKSNDVGTADERKRLGSQWRKDPETGVEVLQNALELREALYAILSARIAGRPPPDIALRRFNKIFTRALDGAVVAWRDGHLAFSGKPHRDGIEIFRAIIISASELLTGSRSDRIKQCQDDRGCGWLFIDDSRGFNRRWCSMGDCGNRAKAHRHYARVRCARKG